MRRAERQGRMQRVRAGTSPTFWTRGLASPGLAGTRGLASPVEELLSESHESFEVDSDSRVQLGPASPRTRESGFTALQRVLNPNAQNLKQTLNWRVWSTIQQAY